MDSRLILDGRLVNLVSGKRQVPTYGDPCHCEMDKCRVRFVRFVDSTSVEVMSNDGLVLPDYRHPCQLKLKS